MKMGRRLRCSLVTYNARLTSPAGNVQSFSPAVWRTRRTSLAGSSIHAINDTTNLAGTKPLWETMKAQRISGRRAGARNNYGRFMSRSCLI